LNGDIVFAPAVTKIVTERKLRDRSPAKSNAKSIGAELAVVDVINWTNNSSEANMTLFKRSSRQ
jgi:hypothetical protein